MNRLFAFRIFLAAMMAFGLFSSAAPIPALAENQIQTTFTVNSAGDAGDYTPGNGSCSITTATGGMCTLRAALEEVNALGTGHTITFAADYTIRPATDLPALSKDSTTLTGVGRTILIYPADSNSTTRGLAITGDYCAVHHLNIQHFGTGIIVYGSYNYIGLKDDGVNDNSEGNTLALNNTGVHVDTGTFNQVSSNFIGVDNAGALLGNYVSGVKVSTTFTIIGTDGD
ncbi:MAG TPA: hypothetical protein VFF78_03575, partial [Anaerolineaceae bacterium]|nr:hypothetical protein [Anaerolineaceae bacterium]